MSWWLFLIPVCSAFSCWLIITLFFTILFRPYKPKSIFAMQEQGILPGKQAAISAKAGKLMAGQFFSVRTIEEKITDPSNLQKIMPVIDEHIDDFLRNKLKKEMPFLGIFVGDKTIHSLKKVFLKELENLFPIIMRNYSSNLINELNIEQLITEKIAAVPIGQIEDAFQKNFSKEIRLAKLISGLIGLFIGFIFVLLIYLTSN